MDEANEGAREHLRGVSSRVLVVIVRVSQNVEQCFNQFFILEYFLMVFRGIKPSVSYDIFNQLLIVFIISDVWNLETTSAVHIIGFEVDPEAPRSGCKCNRSLVCLTRLIGGNRGCRPVLPHDQHISTLILRREEDLRNHNQNLAFVWRVDGPHTLHIGWVVSGIVG